MYSTRANYLLLLPFRMELSASLVSSENRSTESDSTELSKLSDAAPISYDDNFDIIHMYMYTEAHLPP